MDTLYTFWDNVTHYNINSVHFVGLMNSATKEFLPSTRLSVGLENVGLGLQGPTALQPISVCPRSTKAVAFAA